MSFYKGLHADLYDLFYDQKDYKGEAKFIVENLRNGLKTDKLNVLELACGTGTHVRHLSGLLKDSTFISTDLSVSMINRAKSKKDIGQNVEFVQMDMTQFKKFKKPFDAVICLFDSIGYVRTNQNVIKVFKNVLYSLKSGGMFIFEFWNAGAMLRDFDHTRVKRFKSGELDIMRISETSLDYPSQTASVSYTIQRFKKGQLLDQLKETQVNRYFLIQEMTALLNSSGFSEIEIYNGFRNDKEITEHDWHSVVVCKK